MSDHDSTSANDAVDEEDAVNGKVPEHHRRVAPLERSVDKLARPIGRFIASQVASGIFLFMAVAAALMLANGSWADSYHALQHQHLMIALGQWSVDMSLRHWLNDGLMVLFFFLLGLEIKRELMAGELRDLHRSSLVFCMAVGGMALPALVYLLVNALAGADAAAGWGVPMATDTAFALGILAALGSRVPRVAIVMLSALAIVDDIGAVLVISLFYTDSIDTLALVYAALSLLALLLLNVAGVRSSSLYLLLGVSLWWWILQSGVHATTAGVLAALTVPVRPFAGTGWFMVQMPRILARFNKVDDPQRSILEQADQEELAQRARTLAADTISPLQRWEYALDKPVILGIVPVFAFLNAGVELPGSVQAVLAAPAALAIVLALVIGKPLGIGLGAWLGLKLGIARMPDGLRPAHVVGLGFLAGIGFTMSLFISGLAFGGSPELAAQAKLGILLGSLIAAVLGTALLLLSSTEQAENS